MAQHHQYVIKDVESSALNQHYKTCNQGIIWNQPITISHVSDYYHRNLLETLLIKFTWERNCNLSVGPIGSDKILLHIVNLEYKFKELLSTAGLGRL